MLHARLWFVGAVSLIFTTCLFAAEPLMVYQGDGLTIRVTGMSEDETSVSGEMVKDGNKFPFTGKVSSQGEMETVTGTFRAGDKSFPFTATYKAGDPTLTFTSDGNVYRLKEVAAGAADAPPARPDAPPARPDAPPTSPDGKNTNVRLSDVQNQNPDGPPADRKPARADLPAQMKFKLFEIPDINMGNKTAYTILAPADWQMQGAVAWSQDQTSYPQINVDIVGPDQSRVSFRPAMSFAYSEMTPAAARDMAGLGMPARQGEAPPRDPAEWLRQKLAQNKGYSNVKLVSDKRDEASERKMREQAVPNPNVQGETTWQVHVAKYTYDFNGTSFTEEIGFNYALMPPMPTQHMTMYSWMFFINGAARAPSDKYDAMKPILYSTVGSLRTVPQWFTQSQILIMQQTQRNHKIGMDEIKRRGEYYNQLSDADMAAWRKTQETGDKQQEQRINQINEVGSFTGPDGSKHKLPIHYDNFYTDGQGNFIGTNSGENPGAGWSKMQPAN